MNSIKAYLTNSEIIEKLTRISQLNLFWLAVADHLETGQYDIKKIKEDITVYGIQALPNFHQLNIRELLYYLNVGRTLHQARENYLPPAKLNANVHFFKAKKSVVKYKGWGKYCHRRLKLHKLEGDHFSIFRQPLVVPFAENFKELLQKIRPNHRSR